MSNDFDNVKTLQIELWEDCDNNCSFCYLKDKRQSTSSEDRLHAIETVYSIIDARLPLGFNAVGLIGGEFFNGQLNTGLLKDAFTTLITDLGTMCEQGLIKQVWVTASLLRNLDDFKYCFSNIHNKDKFIICTSYDTLGRFHWDTRDNWFQNIKELCNLGYRVHTQVIATDAFINEALNSDIMERINKYSMLDFKSPTVCRAEYLDVCGGVSPKTYRELMLSHKNDFGPHFFVEHRNDFIRFLCKVRQLFGDQKLYAYASNKVRSAETHLLTKHITITDRWEKGIENAPCGHPWDSYCYLDSDKCSRCDALSLVED